MKLVKVTITGADNSVKVEDLLPISERFPFVEWGILVSKHSNNVPRFPSSEWLRQLEGWKKVCKFPFHLSCHICGRWVRDICKGNWTILTDLPNLLETFDRLQLNFHASRHDVKEELFLQGLAKAGKQFIFQYENVNNVLFHQAIDAGINAAPLFDRSGGAGVLPIEWRQPILPMCGYAGGLSPENLQEQLQLIDKVAGDVPIWVDAETGIRSQEKFDLKKAIKFLEISESWLKNPNIRTI